MSDGRSFVDYYEILQVDPVCDGKILEVAGRARILGSIARW
jgi:hypothetical protein